MIAIKRALAFTSSLDEHADQILLPPLWSRSSWNGSPIFRDLLAITQSRRHLLCSHHSRRDVVCRAIAQWAKSGVIPVLFSFG
ncbi:hypothetical protein BDW60DRAFT_191705 [Aspergillus nidulans var. acristatus]